MALIIKKPIQTAPVAKAKTAETKRLSLADIKKTGKVSRTEEVGVDSNLNVNQKQEVVARKAVKQYKNVEPQTKKGVSLFVDGEQRKVSKTSKYLLDMLTLDDNK